MLSLQIHSAYPICGLNSWQENRNKKRSNENEPTDYFADYSSFLAYRPHSKMAADLIFFYMHVNWPL